MQEQTARAILRLLGVVSIMIGLCTTSGMAILFVGMADMMSRIPEMGNFSITSLIAYSTPLLFGCGLYVIAPSLARKIVD